MKCAHVVGSPLARQSGGGSPPVSSPLTFFPAAFPPAGMTGNAAAPDRARYEAIDLARSLSSATGAC